MKRPDRRAPGQVHAKVSGNGVYLLLRYHPENAEWDVLTLDSDPPGFDPPGGVRRFADVWFTLGFSERIA